MFDILQTELSSAVHILLEQFYKLGRFVFKNGSFIILVAHFYLFIYFLNLSPLRLKKNVTAGNESSA